MRRDAVASVILMRVPDYVPVPSAFLMCGRHNRQEFEQPDGIEDLREHRLRDYRAQVTDKGGTLHERIAEKAECAVQRPRDPVLQQGLEQFGSKRILDERTGG